MKALLVITIVLFPFLAVAQQKPEPSGSSKSLSRDNVENGNQLQKLKKQIAVLDKKIAELDKKATALEQSLSNKISINNNSLSITSKFVPEDVSMLVKPDSNSYYTGIVITPDPDIDYTGVLIEPNPNIGYTGVVIPEQSTILIQRE